jgi:phage shock protein PspC (stress-responsive transcriptional regulator)
MKKTLTINLGGQVFNIDEDAYYRLNEYLEKIKGHFSGEKEVDDIMNDIELRIAELLGDKINPGKQVIIIRDIEEIIKIMGEPHDFGDFENEEKKKTYHRSSARRIYRDPDNRVLGGVCGGLGAYMGVDPIILRIIFIVAFFGFGIGFFIYLILWIIIPEAKTTAQKIEMRGDPVNVSNIGNFVKDEFDNIKNSFKGKKKNK